MNNVQLLKQMQKLHKEISLNLEELDKLKIISSTEIATEQTKKQYNKLLMKTKKSFSTLETTFKLIAKQKISFPVEFAEIGLEIDDFRKRLEQL